MSALLETRVFILGGMMTKGPQTRRFHVSIGPAVLFERAFTVLKRQAPIDLKLHVPHFRKRVVEREVPEKLLDPFDPEEWELFAVEANVSSGKFYSTSWRLKLEGQFWVVAIGVNNEIITAYKSSARVDTPIESFKRGMDVVAPEDPLFLLVDWVNRQLMARDS